MMAVADLTQPGSWQIDVRALEGRFFGGEPVGILEQLLEATEGPLNRGGTMRPAFTDQSLDWDSLTKQLTTAERADLLDQREGERLAVLAWVRSGLPQEAYQADDFRLPDALARPAITRKYLISSDESPGQGDGNRVRIRSILTDRCVTCHGESGRHEMARWIPLETYEDIQRKCQPEVVSSGFAPWLTALLSAVLPLALVTGPIYYFSSIQTATRRCLAILPLAAFVVLVGAWLLGRPGSYSIHVLLGAAATAVIGVLTQIAASLAALLRGAAK